MIKTLNIDIETFSSVDINKSGLYKYVESPDFEILLFGYSVNNEPAEIIDLANGETIPQEIINALKDKNVTKHAFNASFEWYALSKFFETPLDQWHCTMVRSLYCGFPAKLETVAKALGFPEEKQKMAVGKSLIKLFCTPTEPTNRNGNRTRTLPHHEPDKWELFKRYCIQDVEVEKEILNILKHFPLPTFEQENWIIDQQINAKGILIDKDLVDSAIAIDMEITNNLMDEATKLTNLDNPNSATQLRKWLAEQGVIVANLKKETVSNLIEKTDGPVKRVLEIRQQLSKTSIKKYEAMNNAVCKDGRARGLLQFYGASRTGRWAGRLIQVQNLPRNNIETLEIARDLVKKRDIETLKIIYGNVSDVLSQLIRTSLIPTKGNRLIVSDYSAIEARVIAWLAGEQWRLDVFNSHGKIYEASASQMFGVPIELIKKGNPEYELRSKGKIAELALGYQGSVGALKQMGALEMGLTEEELPDIVRRWRASNRRIQDLWYSMENAALSVLKTGNPVGVRGLILARESDFLNGLDFLTITLPSGRKLYYPKPFIAENAFGKEAVHYYGINESYKWEKISTYGGKLTENVVQAIARDCLAESLKRLYSRGFIPVMHVHDEIVLDEPEDGVSLEEIEALMSEPISWAKDLPLGADGFTTHFYMKD